MSHHNALVPAGSQARQSSSPPPGSPFSHPLLDQAQRAALECVTALRTLRELPDDLAGCRRMKDFAIFQQYWTEDAKSSFREVLRCRRELRLRFAIDTGEILRMANAHYGVLPKVGDATFSSYHEAVLRLLSEGLLTVRSWSKQGRKTMPGGGVSAAHLLDVPETIARIAALDLSELKAQVELEASRARLVLVQVLSERQRIQHTAAGVQDVGETRAPGNWSSTLPEGLADNLLNLELTTPPPITRHVSRTRDGRYFLVLWDSLKRIYHWSEINEDYARQLVEPVRNYGRRVSWTEDLFPPGTTTSSTATTITAAERPASTPSPATAAAGGAGVRDVGETAPPAVGVQDVGERTPSRKRRRGGREPYMHIVWNAAELARTSGKYGDEPSYEAILPGVRQRLSTNADLDVKDWCKRSEDDPEAAVLSLRRYKSRSGRREEVDQNGKTDIS